ncbi:MAG: barstar family protein [Ferruginibacter sp.]
MTKQINIDFYRIHTWAAFYRSLHEQTELPEYFGNNLDALWDWVTGEAVLPLSVLFTNLSDFQLKKFGKLITLMQDAQTELEADFSFCIESRKNADDIG